MISAAYWLLATATLITHILIVVLIGAYIIKRFGKKTLPLYSFFQQFRLTFIFAATLIATLGSLFFSEVAHFAPCILCWFQRIFIYPQALLSYLGLMRNEGRFITPYLLILNCVGIIFSLYHNFILLFPQYAEVIPCDTKGGPSCIIGYHFYYGYITIPLMALTIFTFNIILLMLYNERVSPKKKLVN